MSVETSTYLIFQSEEYPSTAVRFNPDGAHDAVAFSTPRYRVLDLGEHFVDPFGSRDEYDATVDEWSFSDADEAERHLRQCRLDAGLERATKDGYVLVPNEEDTPRFMLQDAWENDHSEWFEEVVGSAGYHHTDAWRGYTTFAPAHGWVEWVGGWVTGYPDASTAYKMDANELYERLSNGDAIPPAPIVWCFGVTSNVFSTAASVLVQEDSIDLLNAWVDELNGGIDAESIARSFG